MAKVTAKAEVASAPSYNSKSSDDIGFDDGHCAEHAPKGHGKTILAATAANGCPEELAEGLPCKKRFELADMGWIAFDRAAVAGFKELNLFLPAGRYIDGAQIIADLGISRGIATVIALAEEATEKFGIKRWAIDTVSALDKKINGYFSKVHENSDNTYAMYRDIFNYHKQFYDGVNGLGVPLNLLFHSKAIPEAQTTQSKNVQAAQKNAGGEAISVDVTGQARGLYLNDCVLIVAILGTPELKAGVKDKTKMRRVVYPFGGRGFDGGSRFQQALEAEERPHLGLIRKKILNYKG